jgi:prophage antirepressor-like protein
MQLLIFQFDDDITMNDLTTVEIDGEPWFVAADVCKLLDIKNVTQALNRLDEDEKLPYVINRAGQSRNLNLVNESGLYALIFRSKKETAKQFRKWVTKEVIPSIRKKGVYGIDRVQTPNFVIRFNDNWDKTSKGHFSVISELFVRLYGKFEHVGYQIPNKALSGKEIRPDVSVGLRFARYLRENHPEVADDFTFYPHKFPDGSTIEARQYKNDMLPIFIQFIDDEWIPVCAEPYFKDRDQRALEYLPKLLGRGN